MEIFRWSGDKGAGMANNFVCLSLSIQTDLESGVTAALMKVQWSSEPDLAAQHRALQFSIQRKEEGNRAEPTLGWAGRVLLVWTPIYYKVNKTKTTLFNASYYTYGIALEMIVDETLLYKR